MTETIPPFDLLACIGDEAVAERKDVANAREWWRDITSRMPYHVREAMRWKSPVDDRRLVVLRSARREGREGRGRDLGQLIDALTTLRFVCVGLNPWHESLRREEWMRLTVATIADAGLARTVADNLLRDNP